MNRVTNYLLITAFILTVPLANFMVANVGTSCIPNGPCIVPVFPGISAPSGVLVIGFALVLRDFVQIRVGLKLTLLLVTLGCAITYLVSLRGLATASAFAYLTSEIVDSFAFSLLRKFGIYIAVLGSGAVSLVVDSAIFLQLAFGSLAFIDGQVIGKLYATLFALFVIWLIRRFSSLD